jgi:glycosyltransferase involved in cell wall biosynthesis
MEQRYADLPHQKPECPAEDQAKRKWRNRGFVVTKRLGQMPNVSVIIPSYNCAACVGGALESIRSQTMQDFEVIVVDDGSTDKTYQIVEPYLVDTRYRYVYQENRGLPGARNSGALLARAPYIAFLDADDALDSEALEKMWSTLSRSGACWCVIDLVKVFGTEREVRRTQLPSGDLLYGILADDFIRRAMFFRREDFMDVGMYDEQMRNREDWDINIRMIEAGKKFVYIPEPLYLYSWREGSITTGNPVPMLAYAECILRKHSKRLADEGNLRCRTIYAEGMWNLARKYYYLTGNVWKAMACARESLAYEGTLWRLLHPVIHQMNKRIGQCQEYSWRKRLNKVESK